MTTLGLDPRFFRFPLDIPYLCAEAGGDKVQLRCAHDALADALVGTALLELSPATPARKLASSGLAAGGAANALLACRRAGGNERWIVRGADDAPQSCALVTMPATAGDVVGRRRTRLKGDGPRG